MGSKVKIAGGSLEGCPLPGRTPFVWGDCNICWEGTTGDGWWIADIADDAVGPAGEADIACDRAFVTPETGSDFELGQIPREDFFFEDQVPDSTFEPCPALLCDGEAETVEVEEEDEDDAREDEELVLCRFFRGINIRDTSSAFIDVSAPCPLLPVEYHPKRGPDCTLGGDATAVMSKDGGIRGVYPSCFSLSRGFSASPRAGCDA